MLGVPAVKVPFSVGLYSIIGCVPVLMSPALFNTLTDWSSHAKFKNEANKVATIYNREAKVRKVIPLLESMAQAA